jgi:hypothetical protein
MFLVSAFAAALTLPVTLSCQTSPDQVLMASASLPEAPQPQPATLPAGESFAEESQSSQQPASSSEQAPAPAPDHPLTEEEKKKLSEEQLQIQLHQRMAGVVPNFNAVLGGTALPQTPGQKMRAAFRSAIDPYQFGLAFITSGYGQATDSHSSIDANGTRHGYGQGWAGFGERYGANYVDQFNGTIIGNGVLPVLLHQDPRYYRMGTGSFKKRFLYSLSTTVVARGDNGKKQPNYSNVLGNLVSGGISNIYYPRAERGFALTVEQGMEVTAEGSFGALLIEFYPDIKRHFQKKKQTP